MTQLILYMSRFVKNMLNIILQRLFGASHPKLTPYQQGQFAHPDAENPFPVDTFYYREWQKGREFTEWDSKQW